MKEKSKFLGVAVFCIVIVIFLMPGVLAENKNINDIPIKVVWFIYVNESTREITSVLIYINSSEDTSTSHTIIKNITLSSGNSSSNTEIDIERNVVCAEEDISNLTKTLIQSNIGVLNTLNNSFSFPKEYSDCIDGRARIAENNKVYLQERDRFKNESNLYQGLYEDEQGSKDQLKTRLDNCNSDLLTKNTDYNTCTTDLEKSKKKPSQYAIISIVITLIAVNMYNKSKEPKMPETFQFGNR